MYLQCKIYKVTTGNWTLSGTLVSQINSPRQFPAFCACAPFFTSRILFPFCAKKPGTVSQLLFVEKWLILNYTFSFHFLFELNCSVHGAKSKQATHKLLQSSSPFNHRNRTHCKSIRESWNSHLFLKVITKTK